jgi:predicted exporter
VPFLDLESRASFQNGAAQHRLCGRTHIYSARDRRAVVILCQDPQGLLAHHVRGHQAG